MMLKSERSKVLYWILALFALHHQQCFLQPAMARKLQCGSRPQILLGCPNINDPFIRMDTIETRFTFMEEAAQISNIIMFDYPGDPTEAEIHFQVLLANLECTVLILYSRSCEHSARLGPHANAAARAFPNITFVAVDVFEHPFVIGSGNYRIILGTPLLILLQNGKLRGYMYQQGGAIAMNITSLATILEKHTDQVRASDLKILPRDYEGPIPTVAVPAYGGYDVIFCWIFILLSLIYLKYARKPVLFLPEPAS